MTNYMELEDRYQSGVYAKRPITIVRGAGAHVWDDSGKLVPFARAAFGEVLKIIDDES